MEYKGNPEKAREEMTQRSDHNYSALTLGFVAGVALSIVSTIALIVTKLP